MEIGERGLQIPRCLVAQLTVLEIQAVYKKVAVGMQDRQVLQEQVNQHGPKRILKHMQKLKGTSTISPYIPCIVYTYMHIYIYTYIYMYIC